MTTKKVLYSISLRMPIVSINNVFHTAVTMLIPNVVLEDIIIFYLSSVHVFTTLPQSSTPMIVPCYLVPVTVIVWNLLIRALTLFSRPRAGLATVCVVCVFFPSILDIKFVGRTSRGHTEGRSHRISHPPFFCGACLSFSREKDSAVPFPRRP